MKVKKKVLSLLLILALLLPAFTPAIAADAGTASVPFSDLENNWAKQALTSAVDNGLLNGMDGYMRPEDPLTRAQLAAVINRAFGAVTEAALPAGTDVSTDAWYAADIRKAVQMGTFTGDPGGKFRPEDPITRQEAFAVVARAFKVPSGTAGDLASFSDAGRVSSWAVNSVAGLVKAGFVSGSNGRLSPADNITRGQFAAILNRMVSQYITEAGTFEAGYVAPEGSVLVRVPGVMLKNLTIMGDLIIGDGVGDGEVTLDGVTVRGRIVIRGGGENSLRIIGNSSVGTVIVTRVDGEVRVVVSGGAEVEVIYIDDGSDDVTLEGQVGDVVVEASGIAVKVENAIIDSLNIDSNNTNFVVGSGSSVGTLTISEGTRGTNISNAGTIERIEANAPTAVTGEGTISEAVVSPGGSGSSFVKAPGLTTLQTGASANVGGRTIDNTSGTSPRSVLAPPPAVSEGGGSGSNGGDNDGDNGNTVDTTAPSFNAGYPRAGAARAAGSRQVEILVRVNENGTAYYVVVFDGAAAPTAVQVMSGQNSAGGAALASSNGAITANTEKSFVTAALPADATAYDVYVVVKDASGNTTAAMKVDVTTPAAAPVDPEDITTASVAITVPYPGSVPENAAEVEAATANADYTVTGVVWNEALTAGGKFKAATAYTATVTLTSKNNKEFQAIPFTPTVAESASVGQTVTAGTGIGNTVQFTVTYNVTAALVVTGIAVKTQPADLSYTEGDNLDLTGIEVTLTYNDGTAEDVAPAGFAAKGITASPAHGTALTAAAHNGHPVTLTVGARTATTNNLTVTAEEPEGPVDITAATVVITAPVAGAAPEDAEAVEAATANADYMVTDIEWYGDLTQDGKFKAAGEYSATITLTSKNGKKFQAEPFTPQIEGVDEEDIDQTTTQGAEVGNTVIFDVYFDETDALTPAEVTGIAVKTQPGDLRYAAGEHMQLEGLVVTLTNAAGTVQDVPYPFGWMEIGASPDDGEELTAAEHNGQPVVITCNGVTADTDLLTVLADGTPEPVINDVVIPAGCYGIGDDIDVTILADGAGYTDGEITVNGRAVSDFDYVGQDGENYIYEVTYTVSAGDESREGVLTIPVSVELYNGTEPNVPAYTDHPVTNGLVIIDGLHTALFTVDEPTTADNDINGDGKSSVTIYWNDAPADAGIDHYEVIARNLIVPSEDDTVAGMTDIAPGAEIATFDWDAEETVYVGVVAVDGEGNKIRRLNGNCYVVVAPDTAEDTTPPAVVSFSPENGAVDVGLDADLVMTFSENVTAVGGEIFIFKSDNSLLDSTEVTGSEVSVSGGVVSIDPDVVLQPDTSYYVQIDPGAFEDIAGNPYAGISNDSTWAFTTTAVPAPTISEVTIEPGHYNAGDQITLTIVTDGEGYTAGAITVNGKDVSGTLAGIGGNTRYTVTYTVASGDTNRASAGAIPISIVLLNGDRACEPYTGQPTSTGTVEIDTHTPAFSGISALTTADNVADGDGKSTVTVAWTDSEAADVDHYEVFVCDVWRTPTDDDAVEGLTDIGPGTEMASFDWEAGAEIWIAVAAVDDAGNKALYPLQDDHVMVAGDTALNDDPLTVDLLFPAVGADDVDTGSNLVLTFNKNVRAAEGTISVYESVYEAVYESDNILAAAIEADSALVSINGDTVTIDPAGNFEYGTSYYVQIEEGTFIDGSGNEYAGIGDDSWSFTVMDEPAAPVISGATVAPGLYGIGDTLTVTITADGPNYTAGAITVNLRNVSGTLAYIGEEGGSHIYSVDYIPAAADANRASAANIPISVVLVNVDLPCAAYTGSLTVSPPGPVAIDVDTPYPSVNVPTTADNGEPGDGKSSVTVTWTDSAAADVDHYEVAARTGSWPTVDDTVGGLTNIAPGTQTATFEWTAGDTLYVSVIAVDDAGNKGIRHHLPGSPIVVTEDTP
jgi:hypothetical protein